MTTKPKLAWTHWSPSQVRRAAAEALRLKKRSYAALKAIPAAKRSFSSVVEAMERADEAVDNLIVPVDFLMSVSPSKAVRDASMISMQKFKEGATDLVYDRGVYQAVMDALARKEKLGPVQSKLAQDYREFFERLGFHLPITKRRLVMKIIKKQHLLSTKFQKRIDDYRESITLASSETQGLSAAFIASLKKDSRGQYVIDIPSPEYIPFMQQSQNLGKRREAVRKRLQQGGQQNIKTLREVLVLRERKAKLLGYKNHAAFKLKYKMAKSPAAVSSFLGKLSRSLTPAVRRELSKLEKLKGGKITFEEVSLYSNKLQQKLYGFNAEELRQYFPLEHVKQQMFKIYSKLFSVKFSVVKGMPKWHKDVELYHVSGSGGLSSYFFLDLFPRPGKYTHAAMFGIQSQPQVCAMVTNFPKPRPGHPSLLSHAEVETFFHEFGHVLHQVLTRARYASQAGTNVTRDFVELPSQLLENWVWDAAMLKRLSRHHRTKKPMPDQLIKKLLASEKFMLAWDTMRQITLGQFDMSLHTKKPASNPAQVYNQLYKKLMGIAMPSRNLFPSGFGHLMGYDAGYYSYLWSKVYAADVFSVFKAKGLLNTTVGMRYKKEILERGSSRKEIESLLSFLNRKPSSAAFLKGIGVR